MTAIERKKISFPMNWLKNNNLLKKKILDFGCGYGSDVKFLKQNGYNVKGYDNYYFKQYPKEKFDTISCIYVLNVLEPIEQSDVLMSISELLAPKGKAYFVVRRDIDYQGFRTHYIHKKPTYQTNVKLPYKSIFKNDSCEIYEYQHFNLLNINKNICMFCSPVNEVILETASAFSIYDKFPISLGHCLIIPKRHVSSYFDLALNEQISCLLIINRLKDIIQAKYKPDGFNIGININKSSGQTINHVHIHLIPRYIGDVQDPVGGVRNIIQLKGNYIANKEIWEK